MRENLNKIGQRGERLDTLQDKTDQLAEGASGFRRGANRVRKQVSYQFHIYKGHSLQVGQATVVNWTPQANPLFADVVERHEDENVPDCWYNYPANRHHCTIW